MEQNDNIMKFNGYYGNNYFSQINYLVSMKYVEGTLVDIGETSVPGPPKEGTDNFVLRSFVAGPITLACRNI